MRALALSAIACVTLACRSRVTTTGTSGPSRCRSRASSSPSPSSYESTTIAPCRCSKTPSIGACRSAASRIMPPICSNASSLTMPDGLALAETGWIRVQPYLSAASKVAPRAERVPRNAAGISLSRWKSRRRHSAMSVRCTLNVLVSCMNRPVRTRFTGGRPSPRRDRSLLALSELLVELRQDLEQIADDAVIGDLEDRRLVVLVDRDDDLGILHPGEVLDRARNADRDIELGGDDLAGLADLVVVGNKAGIDRGARGADRGAELVGDLLQEVEVVARLHAATARDDDPGA